MYQTTWTFWLIDYQAKNTTWEGGVRTTGIIWSPLLPIERRGMVINDLFDITDWLPTFLEAAGDNKKSIL